MFLRIRMLVNMGPDVINWDIWLRCHISRCKHFMAIVVL